MTSMDNPEFRSQDWASQQHWKGQEAESSALSSIGTEAGNTVRYLQDLQQRKQEFDLRTQQWQVERQIQMQKLAEMQAIDITEKGRLEVETMKQTARGLSIQNDHQEEALKQFKSSSQQLAPAERAMLQYGTGIAHLVESGVLIPDSSKPLGYRHAKDENEAQTQREQVAKAKSMQTGIGARESAKNQRAKTLFQSLYSERQDLDAKQGKYKTMTPEDREKARAEIDRQIEEIRNDLSGHPQNEVKSPVGEPPPRFKEDDSEMVDMLKDLGIGGGK